jgi:hypothetical protein
MPIPKITIDGVSVVMRGSLNPAIFQPVWFSANGLAKKRDANDAVIGVVHPEITAFKLGSIDLQVSQDRFQASTTEPPSFPVLRDLVIGTFKLLRHTPITKLGINRDFHFEYQEDCSWETLAQRLAPSSAWDKVLSEPRVKTVIVQGDREDGREGYLQLHAEPSVREPKGVYFKVNDHYEVAELDSGVGAEAALDVLERGFDKSVRRSRTMVTQVMEALCLPES